MCWISLHSQLRHGWMIAASSTQVQKGGRLTFLNFLLPCKQCLLQRADVALTFQGCIGVLQPRQELMLFQQTETKTASTPCREACWPTQNFSSQTGQRHYRTYPGRSDLRWNNFARWPCFSSTKTEHQRSKLVHGHSCLERTGLPTDNRALRKSCPENYLLFD